MYTIITQHYILLHPILDCRNLRAVSVSDGGAILTWSAGDDLKDEEEEDGDSSRVRLPSAHYEVYYKSVGDNSTSASVFESDKVTL